MKHKWIQKAIGKPGALHRALGIPPDHTIPAEKLHTAASGTGLMAKRARLALTLKKLHK